MKKYLLIFNNGPFADSTNLEGIELAFALAAFEQKVSLLFLHDSVLQLIAEKKSNVIELKDYTKALSGLELFGIEQVYADNAAISKYKLDISSMLVKPELLNDTEISNLISDFDIILNI